LFSAAMVVEQAAKRRGSRCLRIPLIHSRLRGAWQISRS
jgi:hypothetical protein